MQPLVRHQLNQRDERGRADLQLRPQQQPGKAGVQGGRDLGPGAHVHPLLRFQ